MRFVIYDSDSLEPITVVSVPGFGERDIERMHRRVRLAVPAQLSFEVAPENDIPRSASLRMQVVDLWFERFVRGRVQTWMCFTNSADLAMLLDPAWLPGQQREINRRNEENKSLSRLIAAAIAFSQR